MATEEMSKYEKEIDALRKKRSEGISRIATMTQEVEEVLNHLAMDDGDILVTWDELRKTELGVPLQVNDKVSFIKYLDDGSSQGFKVFLKAGGSFGMQKHDCLEETIVVKGNLIETFRNHKEYKEGQTVTYITCQTHKPYCTVDSIYNTLFSNECKNKPCPCNLNTTGQQKI